MRFRDAVVIAHRGNAWDHQENTVAAVESARLHGFDHVEIDIQIHDGNMVLGHDAGVAGEPVEALAEWHKQHPAVKLFLDFKADGLTAHSWFPFLDDCTDLFESFVPVSHNPEVIVAAHVMGMLDTGYVMFRIPTRDEVQYARVLGPEWVFINQIFVPFGGPPPAPWKWAIYEIENKDQAERAVKWGAAGLETSRCKSASQWNP